ncbi:hypothetical protein [Nocardia sp. NPDC050710]|uniref:hypothetical protein n=1 Tax=Nocardia sp. NPDC050710 TaxID=3157220 RepID=UPI0033D5E340
MLDSVHALDPATLRAALEDLRLSPAAIDGTLSRLDEIQTRGMITGQNWPGEIRRWSRYGTLHP